MNINTNSTNSKTTLDNPAVAAFRKARLLFYFMEYETSIWTIPVDWWFHIDCVIDLAMVDVVVVTFSVSL